MKRSFLLPFLGLVAVAFGASAQDTTRRGTRTVEVTSTFKPVLKDAAKINFNATPPTADTTRPRLQYNVPVQNLALAYVPGTLKPLALGIDTGGRWVNHNYIKVGFGTLKAPYLETGLSVGDGKTMGLNAYAKHTSSEGRIEHQKFSYTSLDARAFFQTANNLEWTAGFGGRQEKYNKYGFEPKTLNFSKDSLRVKYNAWRGRIGLHNINRTEFGLSYAPEVQIGFFNDALNNNEVNGQINAPVQKWVTKNIGAEVVLTADLTRYRPDDKKAISNNFAVLAPALLYQNANLNIKAGLKPSWDNGDFRAFPNITAEVSSLDRRFTFMAGWIGYLRKNSFESLAAYNPWIWAPDFSNNSSVDERYAGFKGSVGDHFTYSAKAGFRKITNQPLFVNDTVSGKSFRVINERQLKVIHIGGEAGYTVGEKFSLVSNVAFNNYINLKTEDKSWGLLPMEWKTSLRLQVLKDLYVKSNLYAFGGVWHQTKDGRERSNGALDLSAGFEFTVVKNVKVWAQFNNLFNSQYQRWHQYPVYPFNLLGGVVFSFDQNNP